MDWIEKKVLITDFLKKYRWAAIVLLIGVILMAVPEEKTEEEPSVVSDISESTEVNLQRKLEEILSKLDGAGRVEVLLTVNTGEKTHYQTNEDISRTQETMDHRIETVLISGTDRSEHGLISQIDPPTYQGAVIICQGGDHASVRLAVVEAVKTATGLTSDRITVLKMK